MHPTLSILPVLLLLLRTSLSAAAPSADCFKQQRDSYTKPADGTTRISAGVICPEQGNQSCPLNGGGYMNASSTLNISTSRTADVFEAIGKAVKTEFHASFYGTINNQTFQVEPGRAGFLGFTLTYRCYDGVTGDCVDDDVPSGTPLTACKPATLDGDDSQPYPALDGTTNFVTTSPESVKDMPTNPAAEIPKNAPKVDSGAATFGQGGGISMAIFMSMGIVAWLAL